MEMTQIKQNKLKMILQFSIPSIIAMLLQNVITITDGFYTGNYVGEQALAAINLGLPILYFYLGVGLCMFVSIAGCILNVILDYMFVGVLRLGVLGSAIGSLIVQMVSVWIQLGYFMGKSREIKFHSFVFDWKINREILLNGSSEFIGEMSSAISMFAFNYVLMKYVGAEGVAAFTILGFVVYGYSMICIGFGQGISPLVSVCRGAHEMQVAIDIRKITNGILFLTGVVIAGIFAMTGKGYAGMFGCSSSVADMVATGFRIYSITFFVMGYDVINSMYFTSCGDAKSSALISSLRGIVLLLAFILILPALLGMNGVWLATPCTEILTAIVSLCLIQAQQKKIKRDDNNGKQEKCTDWHNDTECGY